MGSPLSATRAKVYLQYLEEMFIKHWLETHEIILYWRYVDDILIIFDTTKTNKHTIQTSMNMIHPLLHFTPTNDFENVITYLDLTIHWLNHTLQLGVYHKPTQIFATIHYISNHPTQHKLAAYRYHINWMLSLPITEPAKNHVWPLICTTACNNGSPSHVIHKLRNYLTSQTQHHTMEHTFRKTWMPFTFYSPLVYSIRLPTSSDIHHYK
jgi:hypothetical protein